MFMRRAVRKMRQAISPRLATSRLLITRVPWLHAEHAKACRLLRRVAHHREREDRLLEGLLLRRGPVVALGLQLLALHRREHTRRLLPTHARDARIRPLKKE